VVYDLGFMLPQLRAAIGDVSVKERVALAAVVTCNSGGAVADPGVCSAIRLSFIDPEPGDEPHSVLVAALTAAGWTNADMAEVSLAIWHLGEHHPRPWFWAALASEVAVAGEAATRRGVPLHSPTG